MSKFFIDPCPGQRSETTFSLQSRTDPYAYDTKCLYVDFGTLGGTPHSYCLRKDAHYFDTVLVQTVENACQIRTKQGLYCTNTNDQGKHWQTTCLVTVCTGNKDMTRYYLSIGEFALEGLILPEERSHNRSPPDPEWAKFILVGWEATFP